jgi:hypothetical protein
MRYALGNNGAYKVGGMPCRLLAGVRLQRGRQRK